jgi:hypothetical protein
LGITLTNNYLQEEIKNSLNSGNAYYRLVQNLLSSRFLSKNLKNKEYRTAILLILYGFEMWSLTLREERRLRVPENRVLKAIFCPKVTR